MIRFEAVSKVYPTNHGEVRALDDVSLHIAAGEFVSMCGPSGCGKSTLLMLAGGLHRPTSGRIEVAGQELSAMTPAERSRFRGQQIGFVFQMFHLLPYLNVVDNVLVAAAGSSAAIEARARELLTASGLGPRLRHRPAELSAGERQRVALARALLNRPAVLLADEPTGNLDPVSAAAVLDLLAEYRAGGGTVVLATHDAGAAARAGRTLRMSAGRLEGAPAAGAAGS